MAPPFSSEHFLQVFAEYNDGVWPIQIAFVLLAAWGGRIVGVSAVRFFGVLEDLMLPVAGLAVGGDPGARGSATR